VNIEQIAQGVRLDPEGYWIDQSTGEVSYPQHGNDECYRVEQDSFWFEHRNRAILSAIESFPPMAAPILDIGGGNGFVAKFLLDSGYDTILVEPNPAGARNAVHRGVPQVICGTVEASRFRDHFAGAIGLFDVIEHIQDDIGFLRSLQPLLQPKGRLYITAPAFSFLWSSEDDRAGHYRRHTLDTLSLTIEKAGFHVEYSTYFFWFLPAPLWLFRSLPSKFGVRSNSQASIKREHSVENPLLKYAVDKACDLELTRILGRKKVPFGSSCLAVAS
jgi:SAM-dependent methyltransferase